MNAQTTTLVKSLKAALIAGFLGAGINNIWSLLAAWLGATVPPGFAIAISISSVLPVLIGGFIFFALIRFVPNGKVVWIVLGIAFTLISLYPVFNTTQLPDGTKLDNTFPMLAAPMHIISGILAVWGMPAWSK